MPWNTYLLKRFSGRSYLWHHEVDCVLEPMICFPESTWNRKLFCGRRPKPMKLDGIFSLSGSTDAAKELERQIRDVLLHEGPEISAIS